MMQPRTPRRKRDSVARVSVVQARGFTSKVMPVSRSETSHNVAIASSSRDRPIGGRRTGGPQFTHSGGISARTS